MYLSPEETKVDLIKPSWSEVRALIMSRNKLATFIRDAALGVNSSGASKSPLPPLLQSHFDCQYCYQAAECLIYHALEGGTAVSSGVKELFSYVLKGITPSQLSYFRHWDELLNLEALATAAPSHSWAASADKKRDKCIAGLTFQSCERVGDAAESRYLIKFARDTSMRVSTDDVFNLDTESTSSVEDSLVSGLATAAVASVAMNDRVQISVEASDAVVNNALVRRRKRDSRAAATASSSASGGTAMNNNTDIEDMAGAFRSSSKAVMFTDANVASGFVEFISATEVHVAVSEEPKRFKQYDLVFLLLPASRGTT